MLSKARSKTRLVSWAAAVALAHAAGCAAERAARSDTGCTNCHTLTCQTSPDANAATGSATRSAGPPSPYELGAVWETDSGGHLRLSELRGRPRVFAMFFANCQGVCLMTVDQMKQLRQSLPADARGDVGMVLVTLDPTRDTAERLARYRHEHRLSAEGWTILRGDRRSTAELAALLSVSFSPTSARGFVHSSALTILDSSGRPLEQQRGTHPDLSKMLAVLTGGAPAPSVGAGRP